MRDKLVVANWKMHTTLGEATVLTKSIANRAEDFNRLQIVLASPFLWLVPLVELLAMAPKNILLAAQNASWKQEGALTGEVSPKMLSAIVDYVIIGHSERRVQFGESDELVADKVEAVLAVGLKPIVCVGELTQSVSDKIDPAIIKQCRAVLKDIPAHQAKQLVFAYEPRWAIGTGKSASAAHTAKVVGAIRRCIEERFSAEEAEAISILYGGSVDSESVERYAKFDTLDGFLVGKASLTAREFNRICAKVQGEV